ncbi:MAG: response regulator [Cyanobacteria bacterium J06621_11]
MALKSSDVVGVTTLAPELKNPLKAEAVQEKLSEKRSKILVVDDLLENLRLLSSLLLEEGYEVKRAPDGAMALSNVPRFQPDLILLDIMMPEIDGYTVCQQLKADPNTQDIPIIFLSALDLTFDKIKAFEVGAADYINKPFHPAEVLARVKNQIRIRQQSLQLQAQQAIIQLQTQQLKAAEEKIAALTQV